DDRYLDPIIGLLIPGGDVLTGVVGLYLVYAAGRAGVGRAVVARMLVNLALDVAAGSIPLVGDLFDLAFKANRRNLALMEKHQGQRQESRGSLLVLIASSLVFLAALAVPVLAAAWLLTQGWSLLTGG